MSAKSRNSIVVCTACGIIFCCLVIFSGCSKQSAQYQDAPLRDGRISIRSAGSMTERCISILTATPASASTSLSGQTARDLSTYFDACYTCYKKKKGYRQEGPDIIL